MKAAIWRGKHDVRIEDVREPSLVNPHDAIVKVSLTSICEADLVPVRRAGVAGHEFMGEIVEIGRACECVKVGDRVVAMSAIACGRCWFCKREQFAACDNTVVADAPCEHAASAMFGCGGYDGAQAEYVRVPFADVGCLEVPPELSDEQALFIGDLVPRAFAAAERCELEQGDTVAVFGGGAVGQIAIRSAFLFGAERVLAIDTAPERLAMAAEAGAIELDADHGELERRIEDLTGGRGPDACIATTGDLDTALRVVRKGGAVAIAGRAVDTASLGAAFAKGVRIDTAQTHFHALAPRLLELVLRGELDPSVVITHRMAFDELPRGYELFARGGACIKVVVRSP